jgi:signal transduction histidine kinase/CheY-like chemotaxis protein
MIGVALSLIAATLGAYIALLAHRFSRAPSMPDQGWFAAVALSVSTFTLCNAVTMSEVASPGLVVLFSRIQIAIGLLHAATWLQYSSAHLRRRSPLDRPLSVGLAAAALALVILEAGFTGRVSPGAFEPLGLRYNHAEPTRAGDAALAAILGALVLVLLRFVRAARARVRHAALHATAIGVLLAMAANDALVLAGVLRTPYLLDLGFVVPTALVTYAVGARVVEDARALADLRRSLEEQVAQRTGALAHSEEARSRAEKLAALGQLAAGVAHEVNNPAAVLSANLRYLSGVAADGRPFPADGSEVLRESRQAVDRIARTVRQLLDASRLAGAAGPTGPVDLAAAAAAAVRLARLRTGDVRVLVEVPPGLHAAAEEQLVVQVIANLVVNGAEAIPSGRPGRVTVRGARAGDRVRLLVEDDGAGMDVDTLRRVFEPFFSTKPFGAGAGLGLAVSRGLVTSLGGDLRLESAAGVGTRAVMELPLIAAAPALPATAVRTEPGARAPRRARRSLLLVDDDASVRASLGRLLSVDYGVTVAATADEGIALARTGRFDVVLCDVMMPDGGAERLAGALDRDAPAAARRLVFLTGGASTPAARAFLADERRPLLAKPLDVLELASVVERLDLYERAPPTA